jgi:hypothetical protein
VARGRAIAAAAVAALLVGAGCGSEKTLTASEFVGQVNEQGVSLKLGRQLPAGSQAESVYAVTLPRLPGEPRPADEEGSGRGPNGTLYAYGGSGAAGDQLDACRASGGLLCYRAANIVVVFDQAESGISAEQLGVAIMRLGS